MPRILYRPESTGLRKTFKYLGGSSSSGHGSTGSTSSSSPWGSTSSSLESSPEGSCSVRQRSAARHADASLSSSADLMAGSQSWLEVPLHQEDQQPRSSSSSSFLPSCVSSTKENEWGFFVDFNEPLVDERHFLGDFTGPQQGSSQLFSIMET